MPFPERCRGLKCASKIQRVFHGANIEKILHAVGPSLHFKSIIKKITTMSSQLNKKEFLEIPLSSVSVKDKVKGGMMGGEQRKLNN